MNARKARVYDEALPADVFARLRREIEAMPPPKRSNWFGAQNRPTNVDELVIDSLRRTVRAGRAFAGAEWWVRRAPSLTSKSLHFDKDEALAV